MKNTNAFHGKREILFVANFSTIDNKICHATPTKGFSRKRKWPHIPIFQGKTV
jgi:hypothetical protein